MWLFASLKLFCILLQSLTNNVEDHRYCQFELCVSIISITDDSSPFCWPNIAILLCNAENVHAHWKLCPPITYFSESFRDARAVQIFILVCHLSLWLLSNDNEKLLQLGFGTMGLLFIRRYKSVVIWSFLKQMGFSYHMQCFQLIFILFCSSFHIEHCM